MRPAAKKGTRKSPYLNNSPSLDELAESYHKPCILRGPHGRGRSKWPHDPCLLGVPIMGKDQYGYVTLVFSGSPQLTVGRRPLGEGGG